MEELINYDFKIAILIPCYNEEITIAGVINGFKEKLPNAEIYVYDNNSTDNTVEVARRSGAIIEHERKQGKGNVVRSMFKNIDADVYVMVDGDGTYPSDKVHDLISPVAAGEADMVIGSRLHTMSESEFGLLNKLGNKFFTYLTRGIFRLNITDLLSGYRAFNRRIVKNLPLSSSGFEIETELTIKSGERGYRILEVPINLSPRTEGSISKIKIIGDGLLILKTILSLSKDYRPLSLFGLLGLVLIICGLFPGVIVIREFLSTGNIHRIFSAIASAGLFLFGLLFLFWGLILKTTSRHFQESDRQLLNLSDETQRIKPRADNKKM